MENIIVYRTHYEPLNIIQLRETDGKSENDLATFIMEISAYVLGNKIEDKVEFEYQTKNERTIGKINGLEIDLSRYEEKREFDFVLEFMTGDKIEVKNVNFENNGFESGNFGANFAKFYMREEEKTYRITLHG